MYSQVKEQKKKKNKEEKLKLWHSPKGKRYVRKCTKSQRESIEETQKGKMPGYCFCYFSIFYEHEKNNFKATPP